MHRLPCNLLLYLACTFPAVALGQTADAADYVRAPEAEVALARSAAPDKISARATVKRSSLLPWMTRWRCTRRQSKTNPKSRGTDPVRPPLTITCLRYPHENRSKNCTPCFVTAM